MNKATLDKILAYAVRNEASDIHLASGNVPIIRVHGKLRKMETQPLTNRHLENLIREILTEEQRQFFYSEKELDFAYAVPGVARFRTNVYWQLRGISIAFRVIPERIRTLDELGAPKGVYQLARSREGLVLVTGPTGSGKSTTLAAMIDLIDTERYLHVITIEDPIEYVYKGKNCLINQRELGPHTKSFANALRAALREDPDVILIGEMRDLETISLALTAAETGHLVFATLHTNSAAETIDRVVDVFPAGQQDQIRAQFANCILGVISQRLIPLKSGKGRVAAMEILIATPAIRNLIRERKIHQIPSALQTGNQYGMQTMDQHLAQLVKEGKISIEDALAYAHDPHFFRKAG
jgi:twitching motility protein PilT